MARKHRAPSPPPSPQEESSSEQSSSGEEEEEVVAPAAPALQKPNDDSWERFDSDTTDAQAFQVRQVVRSPTMHASDADGGSSESEPENPEPARKKRPAPTAKANKANAPEPAPSDKARKANGKAKKPRVEPEQAVPGPSPSSKPAKRVWTTDDEIKILEAIVTHVKSHGTQPRTGHLLATVGDTLQRKNCNYTVIYEKVRNLNKRYDTTAKKVADNGELPVNDDDLRIYNLSLAVWGQKNGDEVVSDSTSQDNGAPLRNANGDSKGVASKDDTTTADEIGGAVTEGKRRQASKQKTGADTKNGSSKEATDGATPAKSKKRGNQKDEMDEDAKNGASMDGGTSVGSKRGKTDKDKLDGDAESVVPKEAVTTTQNCGITTRSKKGETQKEEIDSDANVQGIRRDFVELQSLYPNLASYVERIEAQHPCGVTLKTSFEFISDEKACTLESKIKKHKIAQVQMQNRRADITKEVVNMFF